MLHNEAGVLEREGAEPESQALHGQSRSHSVEEDLEEDSKFVYLLFFLGIYITTEITYDSLKCVCVCV